MEQKKKSWFRRHWIISIILVFVIIGTIGSLFDNEEAQNSNKESSSIKKEPMDLLPTREEIDSEWENIKINNQDIDASGFDSGASLEMDRMESLSLSLAYIFVYKFDSKNYADSFYSAEINKVKERGGYTEISTSGIDAICFGYKGGDLYEGYYYSFYCKKDNIFFQTEVATFSAWRSGYSKELAKIVADKI